MAGAYNLTVTNSTTGCVSNSVSTTVVVNAKPTATASSNSPVFERGTITLTGGPSGAYNYSWSGPNGFSSTSQSPTVSTNATLAMAGTYTLTVTNSTTGCSVSNSTDVVVNAIPTVIEVAAPSPIDFGMLVWGTNQKFSATNGTVNFTLGTDNPTGWEVTAVDAKTPNKGYMTKTGPTPLASGKLEISANGTTWAYADTGITYAGGATNGTYPLPFWAKQVISTVEAVGNYSITITFTGEILFG